MSGQCRFCKDIDDAGMRKMMHYAVRHYAHATCGLKAKGKAFLDSLTDWQIYALLPYKAAQEAGPEIYAEYLRRCALHEAAEKASVS